MARKFSKYETLGNDFIVADAADGWAAEDLAPKIARNLCARGTGISACGVIWIGRGEPGEPARVVAVTADGSRPPMSDDAARCAAAHLARTRRIVTGKPASIDAGAGLLRVLLLAEEAGSRWTVSVAMGAVLVAEKATYIGLPGGSLHDVAQGEGEAQTWEPPPPADAASQRWIDAFAVDVGRPAVVVNTFSMIDGDDDRVIAALRRRFPSGTVVGFAKRLVEGSLRVRAHELGVGWMPSSGSIACAAASVERVCSWQEANPFEVELDGGTLRVHIDRYADAWHARVTGPARWVFDGTLPDRFTAT